ncbi:glycosyltransferase [Tabrizicola soli]|uniref:Glycosyltransferase n=1 Tax=Tabrizicola soli TaxID=2185115 RepID=A0ABV7E0U1_9RHOB|nr:glycosyltransferase [Tabrizicola soli]
MLHHDSFRDPAPGQLRVLAAFSFRYDAHLVPDLIENIRPAIHGFVAWDDRSAEAALSDEPARRRRLLAAARERGADWLLVPDPDERFEQGFATWLPALLAEGDCLWHFSLREMFSPTEYRSDGPWGAKSVLRLFPIAAAGAEEAALHGLWVADDSGFRRRASRINLYHLRMASPARRKLRRELYAAADPERRFQAIGYDYLDDERGMVLEPLPPGRTFDPPFVEDHGLWSPDPDDLGEIRPDPPEVSLVRVAHALRRSGQRNACYIASDLFHADPVDHDLCFLAASYAFQSGDHPAAIALAGEILTARPQDLSAQLIRARSLVASGRKAGLSALAARLPGSPVIAALRAEAARPTADFTAADAQWRDLAPPDAAIYEERPDRSDLATVVIGFRSQPGLLSAVRSVLDQGTEIVVVNSGGGSVRADLAPVADRIRLITSDTPLRVGAARNIGVAASRAPFIAFLAGDCLAEPGWVAGRLARHHAGAASVSTAVSGLPGAGLVALAANRLRYSARNPFADPRSLSHYGQSCSRHLLGLSGHFPPALSAGEDTALNRAAVGFSQPHWTPGVVTLHRDLTDLALLVADERMRGQRRAGHPPFRALAASPDPALAAAPFLRRRLHQAWELVAREPGLSAAERRAVQAVQWLAAQADGQGTVEGLQRIARADALLALAKAQEDDPDQAIPLAEEALALDPEDPSKSLALGLLRLAAGDMAGGEAALLAALALSPADERAVAALIALRDALEGPVAALHLAERLALAAPSARRLWSLAADQALAAGDAGWAVALGRVALACAPALPAAHAHLAKLHAAAGDPAAEARRAATAERLIAAEERRKG